MQENQRLLVDMYAYVYFKMEIFCKKRIGLLNAVAGIDNRLLKNCLLVSKILI